MNDDIKTIRSRLGWSQHKLAEFLGIDRTTVSRLEAGERPPSGPVQRLLDQLNRESAA